MSNETYTYVNLRLRALELAIGAYEGYDDETIVGVAEKFLAFLEATPKATEDDVVRAFGLNETTPRNPRKFYSNGAIPKDVVEVVTADGFTAERLHKGRGWAYTVSPKGDTYPLDLFAEGWDHFDDYELPVTEVL